MQLIMRIFLRYFSALPVLVVFPSMIGKAASQQSPACAETLADIFFAESAVTDRSVPREYILCEKVYEVGVPDETLGFAGGDFPLVLRSNATAKCGPNGTGDCIIDGSGGVYGIIVSPFGWFEDFDADNIKVEGVTVDFFLAGGSVQQVPVFAGAFDGSISFINCTFSQLGADPNFLLDQYVFTNGRRNVGGLADPLDGINDPFGFQRFYHLHKRLQNLDSAPRSRKQSRVLQAQARPLEISFISCLFQNNEARYEAFSAGGLTLLRFRATDDLMSLSTDVIGQLSVVLRGNEFVDNIYSFDNEMAGYRSLVDFFSAGQIVIENNCFSGSPVGNGFLNISAPIIVQSEATVVAQNNYVSPVQEDLMCPFTIEVEGFDLVFVQCGPSADSQVCTNELPDTLSPTPAVVLPTPPPQSSSPVNAQPTASPVDLTPVPTVPAPIFDPPISVSPVLIPSLSPEAFPTVAPVTRPPVTGRPSDGLVFLPTIFTLPPTTIPPVVRPSITLPPGTFPSLTQAPESPAPVTLAPAVLGPVSEAPSISNPATPSPTPTTSSQAASSRIFFSTIVVSVSTLVLSRS